MDPQALAMSSQIFAKKDFVDWASFKADNTIDICSQQPESLTWNSNYLYMLWPFCLVGLVLMTIHRVKANGVIYAPDWSTQYWGTKLLQMNNQDLLYFQLAPRNLTLPHKPSLKHLLWKKLQLTGIRIIILQKKIQKHLLDYLHIANIIIILINGHLILKI